MHMKMSFMVLEIWSFGSGKVMEIFVKEFVRTLARVTSVEELPFSLPY